MHELHLFAGAGGGILGGILLGHTPVCAVERNPYRRTLLLQRQREGWLPWFPIWDDIYTFDGSPWRGRVDIVSGGFTCQGYSTATRGKVTADDLWPEMAKVVAEVAPRFVFAENTARRAINRAAEDLESMAYTVKCCKISASDLGADHVRKRYWLLAHTNVCSELQQSFNAKMASVPHIPPSVWKTYPDERGVVDGVANRLDRLKAIGDGQIPCVVAFAWRLLHKGLASFTNNTINL